jgi:hypothetical protein
VSRGAPARGAPGYARRIRRLVSLLFVAALLGACGGSSSAGSTEPVSGAMADPTPALLEDVAVDGDRVTFTFRNHVPGYRVEYVEPPLVEDGSGAVVEAAGREFVTVRMATASGADIAGDGSVVYHGPRRVHGTGVVRELVRTGDFEGVLTWAAGLDERAPFEVSTTADPPRLVVDFGG